MKRRRALHVTRPSDKRGVPGITGAAGGTAARWRTPQQTVEFINAPQKWALEGTRLGIPVLVHEESLHGYMATEATMFPQAIALAGTFDTDLMRRVQSVIARITLAPGESRTVRFALTPAQLAFWNRDMQEMNEPGPVAVHVGNSSANLKSAKVAVAA